MSDPGRILLDHVTLTVSDLAAAAAFYDAALAPLGLVRGAELLDPEDEDEVGVEATCWSGPDGRAVLWVVAGRAPTAGVHLAFAAPDPVAVRAFHEAGLAAGGASRRAPRGWEIYRPGGFGAILAAPDGTLVEARLEADVSTTSVSGVTLAP